MRSNKQKGDEFRDLVIQMLGAAGLLPLKEVRKGFKKIDAELWSMPRFGGSLKIAIETKDYAATFSKKLCTDFVSEYEALVQKRHVDEAWLVSRGEIAPDGRELIKAYKSLKCFTLEELQREILMLDAMLLAIQHEHKSAGLQEYYISPRIKSGERLNDYVAAWLKSASPAPLVVLGAYGQGKSTFALDFAADLAAQALNGRILRAPILVRLGEVTQEIAIEGIIGRELASRYRVGNYHFKLAKTLNDAGRFVIIFDGLDEMKQGMSFEVFQQNITELLKMDAPRARIIMLGRDTAFHNESEYEEFVLGRRRSGADRYVQIPNRRSFDVVQLIDFSVAESKDFVERYFRWLAKKEEGLTGKKFGPRFIARRIVELQEPKLETLICRPVHAQMLCQIGLQKDLTVNSTSLFTLYDTFLDYLLHRELAKVGRSAKIDALIRRRFNAAIANWLWRAGGKTALKLEDIPLEFCTAAVGDAQHGMSMNELKRELVAGLFVEKGDGTLYYPHKSMQDFLVANYLWENTLFSNSSTELLGLLPLINADIATFVASRLIAGDTIANPQFVLEMLASLEKRDIPVTHLGLFVEVLKTVGLPPNYEAAGNWQLWVSYFVLNEGLEFRLRSETARNWLDSSVRELATKPRQELTAFLYLWARVAAASEDKCLELARSLIKAILTALFSNQSKAVPADTRSYLESVLAFSCTIFVDDEDEPSEAGRSKAAATTSKQFLRFSLSRLTEGLWLKLRGHVIEQGETQDSRSQLPLIAISLASLAKELKETGMTDSTVTKKLGRLRALTKAKKRVSNWRPQTVKRSGSGSAIAVKVYR